MPSWASWASSSSRRSLASWTEEGRSEDRAGVTLLLQGTSGVAGRSELQKLPPLLFEVFIEFPFNFFLFLLLDVGLRKKGMRPSFFLGRMLLVMVVVVFVNVLAEGMTVGTKNMKWRSACPCRDKFIVIF